MSCRNPGEEKKLELLLNRYFHLDSIVWRGKLGGFSSDNFALSAGSKSFVLKRFGRRAITQIDRLGAIAIFLRDKNFPSSLPETTNTGQLYFSCEGDLFSLFVREPGFVRHGIDLSDTAIKSTADYLARLHRLKPKNASSFLGPRRRDLYQFPSSLVVKDCFCTKNIQEDEIPGRNQILLQSLHTKRRVIEKSNYERCAFLEQGDHFVHGDFHNGNVLFDVDAKVTCILDFEESFIGHGACDVVSFVFLALCSEGFSDSILRVGRQFLNYYRSIMPTDNWVIEAAIERHFLLLASSTFFEECLVEGKPFFLNLLRRDIVKMDAWMREPQRIVQALI